MLRLTEILLFLAPLGLFVLWWILGSRSPGVVWVAVAVVLVLGAGMVWFALTEGLPRGARYVPAHLQGGHVVAGHGA